MLASRHAVRPAPAEGLGEGATTKNNPRPQGGRKQEGGVSHGLRQQRPVSQSQGLDGSKLKVQKGASSSSGIKPAEWARSARPWKIPGSQDQEKEGRADTCPWRPSFQPVLQQVCHHPWVTGEEIEALEHKTPHLKPHTQRVTAGAGIV